MSLLRLLNLQGIAGLAVAVALGILLLVQKGETRHWRKESGQFEQLYGQQQAALATTVANYRAAAAQAAAADRANAGGSPPSSAPSMKGHRMILKRALPPLACLLSACAAECRRRSRSRHWRSSTSARPIRCRRRTC